MSDERRPRTRWPTGRSTRKVGLEISARERRPARHRCRPLHRRPGRPHPGLLHAWPVQAPHAHARVTELDVEPAYDVPGVVRVLTADDVPGVNDAGIKHDEPLFPDEVMFYGHAVCWVLGRDRGGGPDGRRRRRGRLRAAAVADHRRGGDRGGELPGPPADRLPRRRGGRPGRGGPPVLAASSSSAARSTSTWRPTPPWPRSTRTARSSSSPAPSTRRRPRRSSPTCSACSAHEVTVQCLRMGGGFGGKEMQPHGFAAIAALGATLTGRPVRLRLNRTQDITMSGKRHPFHATWEVGFDADMRITRAAGHPDQRRRLEPRPVRAGAGPGAVPHRQRLLDPEHRGARPDRQDQQDLADRVPRLRRAAGHDRDRGHPRPLRPAAGRRAGGAAAPQPLRARPDHPVRAAGPARRAARATSGTSCSSAATSPGGRPRSRRSTPSHPHTKRGLAITPVKFGISFNLTAFNQAGALVHVYKDGSVLINHGGTEMGQGLHTKMIQVAATALGVPLSYVRLAPDPDRQGAEHLGHRGQLRRRPERRRDQERLRADPGTAGRGGRPDARRPPRRRPVRRRRRHRHRLP